MKKYEIMYIIRPDLDEEARQTLVDHFNKILTDHGAEITEVQEMGKRRLAYEINNYREGIYKVVYAKAETEALNELDRLMKIHDDVIRFMIIRDERETE